jgi:hypothetical protein
MMLLDPNLGPQLNLLEQEEVCNLIAAMNYEYDKDEACDYCRINRLIEIASDVVAKAVGGRDRLRQLGKAMEHLGPERNDD